MLSSEDDNDRKTRAVIQSFDFDKLWSWETAVWVDKNTECNPERLAQLMLQTNSRASRWSAMSAQVGRFKFIQKRGRT